MASVFSPPPISQNLFLTNNDQKTNEQNSDIFNPLKAINSAIFTTTKLPLTDKSNNLMLFNTHINRIAPITGTELMQQQFETKTVKQQNNYKSLLPPNALPQQALNIGQKMTYLLTSAAKEMGNNNNNLQMPNKEQNLMTDKTDLRLHQSQKFLKNNFNQPQFQHTKQEILQTIDNIAALAKQQNQVQQLNLLTQQRLTEDQQKQEQLTLEQEKEKENYKIFANSINNILPNQKQALYFAQRRQYSPPIEETKQSLFLYLKIRNYKK